MPRDSSSRDYKERSRRRDSSYSSDSEYSQKSSKKKHRKRSRSKEKSHRRSRRSTSRSKKSSKRNDSRSPISYYSSKRRSPSRERTKRRISRSSSRDRSKSRSRERSDYYSKKHKSLRNSHKSKNYSSRRRSSSRSPTPHSNGPSQFELSKKYIVDDTESKIEKAIKAAEAAGLTMCKLPSYEYKEVEVKEEMPTIQDRNVLDELNNEGFTQRQFSSSRGKKIPDNIVIDLDAGTVKVPDVELPKVESLFHPDLFPDEKLRKEKWIKKMFQFRQKALRADI